jgi:hypothetical protein
MSTRSTQRAWHLYQSVKNYDGFETKGRNAQALVYAFASLCSVHYGVEWNEWKVNSRPVSYFFSRFSVIQRRTSRTSASAGKSPHAAHFLPLNVSYVKGKRSQGIAAIACISTRAPWCISLTGTIARAGSTEIPEKNLP